VDSNLCSLANAILQVELVDLLKTEEAATRATMNGYILARKEPEATGKNLYPVILSQMPRVRGVCMDGLPLSSPAKLGNIVFPHLHRKKGGSSPLPSL